MSSDVVEKLKDGLQLKKPNLYEFRIPFRGRTEYQQLIVKLVDPFISELEKQSLIDHFHFIMHEKLDLRISIKDDKNLDKIKDIAKSKGVNIEISKLDPTSHEELLSYGGEVGDMLRHEALELFSRLFIKLIKAFECIEKEYKASDRDVVLIGLNGLFGQILRYYYIQFGFGNLEQAEMQVMNGVNWFKRVLNNRDRYYEKRIRKLEDRIQELDEAR